MKSEEKMYEYRMLREEIVYLMKLHKMLTLFLYSSIGVYLPFVLKQENPFYILTIYLIVLPIAYKNFYYREQLAKISGYMIIFLEPYLKGVNWESMNLILKRQPHKGKNTNIKQIVYYEYIIIYIFSFSIFIYQYHNSQTIYKSALMLIFIIACILIGGGWLIEKILKDKNIDRTREEWVQRWVKLKNK